MQAKTVVLPYSKLGEEAQHTVDKKYTDRTNIQENFFFEYGGDYHWFKDDIVMNGEIIIVETHEEGIYLFKDGSDLEEDEYIAERKKF